MANRVRIYPTGNYYIPGVPAEEMLLDAEEAAKLLAWSPPAFTTKRPPGQPEPSPEPIEEAPDLPTTESPPDGGLSDSGEHV